ncbi:MAG: N-acetylneuraminate synthase family protein, partial [bacterium]
IEYPAPFESVNLKCLDTLRSAFNCPVGYSDHTQGITVPIAAMALEAELYEKHVTLSEGKSPDHDFALSMDEFALMVKHMRQCEASLGSSIKQVQESERIHYIRGRRSLFVIKDMKKGESFTEDNLAVLRPGVGIPPAKYEEIVGKKATRSIKATALLQEGDWC